MIGTPCGLAPGSRQNMSAANRSNSAGGKIPGRSSHSARRRTLWPYRDLLYNYICNSRYSIQFDLFFSRGVNSVLFFLEWALRQFI